MIADCCPGASEFARQTSGNALPHAAMRGVVHAVALSLPVWMTIAFAIAVLG